ncbi:MAG: ribbon-helix-helix protein, CopG family [Gammaproteobacteria bacterium]|nr:ribbon-helix-helix protein, CopG family [Gammaproteobacteria bacterium]
MADTILISVRVSKDVAKHLSVLAEVTDRSKSYAAAQAIEEFLALQEWQVKAIRTGLSQANGGKLHEHATAVERPKHWGKRGA